MTLHVFVKFKRLHDNKIIRLWIEENKVDKIFDSYKYEVLKYVKSAGYYFSNDVMKRLNKRLNK